MTHMPKLNFNAGVPTPVHEADQMSQRRNHCVKVINNISRLEDMRLSKLFSWQFR